MGREAIWIEGKPKGFIAHANKVGNLVYTAGLGPDDRSGDIARQTEETLNNVSRALKAANSSLAEVLKITIYLSDMKNYTAMNEVYKRFFPENPPARTCIEAKNPMFEKGQLIEIESIAATG